jgi:hypothetical protein
VLAVDKDGRDGPLARHLGQGLLDTRAIGAAVQLMDLDILGQVVLGKHGFRRRAKAWRVHRAERVSRSSEGAGGLPRQSCDDASEDRSFA